MISSGALRFEKAKGNSSQGTGCKDKLNSELHRTPTVAEIAEFTGYTEEQIIEAIESSHAYGTYSLDKTFDEAGEDGENAF